MDVGVGLVAVTAFTARPHAVSISILINTEVDRNTNTRQLFCIFAHEDAGKVVGAIVSFQTILRAVALVRVLRQGDPPGLRSTCVFPTQLTQGQHLVFRVFTPRVFGHILIGDVGLSSHITATLIGLAHVYLGVSARGILTVARRQGQHTEAPNRQAAKGLA